MNLVDGGGVEPPAFVGILAKREHETCLCCLLHQLRP